MANFKDFATGTVAVAPSPATSGNSFTLQSGEGALMPVPPFYATAHPDYQLPTIANAEKILVTARPGNADTFTFTRAQGDTTAKSIAVGWRISNAVFKDDLFNSTVISNEVPSGTINGTNKAFTVSAAFNANTLRVYLNGQRLRSGSSNDYTEGADLRSFTLTFAPQTNDVLLVDYIVGTSILMQGVNVEVQEAPTGSVNGSNAAFSTSKAYITGTLKVFVNGILQAPIAHVTETSPSAGTFTLDTAPLTGDVVRVIYDYALSTGGNAAAVNGIPANTTVAPNQLLPLGANSQFPFAALGTVRLNVSETTDISNGGALTINTWTDVTVNRTFQIGSNNSMAIIIVSGILQVGEGSQGVASCRAVIDSAGTPQNIKIGGSVHPTGGYTNALAGNGIAIVTGLTAGSHTIKVQVRTSNTGNKLYIRPASFPDVEFMNTAVVEMGG